MTHWLTCDINLQCGDHFVDVNKMVDLCSGCKSVMNDHMLIYAFQTIAKNVAKIPEA